MVPSTSAFKLTPGTEFTVPAWAVAAAFDSKHSSKFPDTPKIQPLRREVGGQVTFCAPRRKGQPRELGLHLFIPAGVKSGDVLIVEWVEGKAAAARRKTDTRPSMPIC